jgi:hypothetical protein
MPQSAVSFIAQTQQGRSRECGKMRRCDEAGDPRPIFSISCVAQTNSSLALCTSLLPLQEKNCIASAAAAVQRIEPQMSALDLNCSTQHDSTKCVEARGEQGPGMGVPVPRAASRR